MELRKELGNALMRILAISALVLWTASASHAAAWNGGSSYNTGWWWSCGTPTLENCQDPVWLSQTWCGLLEQNAMQVDEVTANSTSLQSTCNTLLLENAAAVAATLPEKVVVIPDELGGGIGYAFVASAEEPGLTYVDMAGSFTGYVLSAAATSGSNGLSPAEVSKRSGWYQNGEVVDSCEEFTYEKNYDYSLFQDSIAGLHSNPRGIFNIAFGPYGSQGAIATRMFYGQPLKAKNGTPLSQGSMVKNISTGQDVFVSFESRIAPKKEKNPFYKMPLELIADETVKNTVVAGQNTWAYFQAYPWYWHWAISYYLSNYYGVLDEEMEAMATLATKFRSELSHRDSLYSNLYSLDKIYMPKGDDMAAAEKCMALAFAGPGAMEQCMMDAQAEANNPMEAAEIEALLAPKKASIELEIAQSEDRIISYFEEAQAQGCINNGALTKCDWSPRKFSGALQNAYGNFGQERQFQSCLQTTKDEFTPLKTKLFKLPNNTPIFEPTPMDYTQNVPSLDLFIERVPEAQEAVLVWTNITTATIGATSTSLVDPDTGNLKAPGHTKSGKHEHGNDDFGIFYDYEVQWGVSGLEDLEQFGLCALAEGVHANFTGGGWAFGKDNKKTLIEVDADADFKVFSADVKLYGKSVWGISEDIPQEYNLVSDPNDTSISGDIVKVETWIPVLGIPIHLEGSISGTVGFNYSVHAELDWQPGEECYVKGLATGTLNPFAKVDAQASVGFDVIIVAAKIKGELNLVDVSLPFVVGIEIGQSTPMLESAYFKAYTRADFNLDALAGSLSLYGRIGVCAFFGLCIEGEEEIFSWDGIEYSTPLFDETYEVNLYDLATVM